MTRLTDAFGFTCGNKIALIGCGGKTSLMYALAEEHRADSVLIGTTTRIFMPEPERYDVCVTSLPANFASRGITLIYSKANNGKITAPTTQTLCDAYPMFDYTILECDGSKGLPLKGWADFEPVIPEFVTATIGVCAMWPVGLPVSDENTHRLPEFTRTTGAHAGDTVTEAHIAAMISHPDGMMKHAVGRHILYINQIESKMASAQAETMVNLLPDAFRKTLSRIVAGSLHQHHFKTLWEV